MFHEELDKRAGWFVRHEVKWKHRLAMLVPAGLPRRGTARIISKCFRVTETLGVYEFVKRSGYELESSICFRQEHVKDDCPDFKRESPVVHAREIVRELYSGLIEVSYFLLYLLV